MIAASSTTAKCDFMKNFINNDLSIHLYPILQNRNYYHIMLNNKVENI
jgi:hypothetical protein